MTIDDFHEKINEIAKSRMGPERFCEYIQHKTREDKYLREEYLPIQAVVCHKQYPGNTVIELGDEKEEWDARVDFTDLFEVAQALPANEYVIRNSIAGGKASIMVPVSNPEEGELAEMPITGPLAQFLIQAKHAYDHFQFPRVIVEAIEKKHGKNYTGERTLVVVFDGDYSFEENQIVREWIKEIRRRAHRGTFREILLVERSRQKVFPVF